MMSPITEIHSGSIGTSSFVSNSVESWCGGAYDVALLASSWDKRSTCIAKVASLRIKKCILVLPRARDSHGLRDEHDQTLRSFATTVAQNTELFEIGTGDLASWPRLRQVFYEAARSELTSGGLRVLIDLSTCPRFLSLALLREALFSGLVRQVDLLYSEGIYPERPKTYDGLEEISFKDGPVKAVPVPGFLSSFEPGGDKVIVCSVGFDGWKTLNLVTREEPDQVYALLASPSSSPEYEERTRHANRFLFEKFANSTDQIFCARAGDAVAVVKVLTARLKGQLEPEKSNVFLLCSGNKPHSLGLALFSLLNDFGTLLYVKPTRHSPVPVKPSGVFWRYEIMQDLVTHYSL